MTYKVDGIYTSDYDGYWVSNEWFVKQGTLRYIDDKICELRFSVMWTRYWLPIDQIDKFIVLEMMGQYWKKKNLRLKEKS